jgi:5-methylthioadenosine/S-adenosylhomocysteine deaminase
MAGGNMLFSDITLLNPKEEPRYKVFVGIRGGEIAYVGDAAPAGEWGRVIDGRGGLLMPGFYNAHAHSPMTLMRGYGENLMLHDWLLTRIFPFENEIRADMAYYAATLAFAESFRYGIVSSSDMYFFTESVIKAAIDSGAKINATRALAGYDEDVDMYDMDMFKEAKHVYETYYGAEDARIIVDMGVHMEETSTERLARQLAEYSAKIGTRVHVHISETKSEHEGCKERREGRTPIAYFNDLGLFDSPATAAHCVWVDEDDMEIMKEKGVNVASCPVSNLKLASGVANVPAMLEKGINVAIGTDSVASNNSLNFIEEMKFFALVSKEKHGDPTLISPEQALYAATRAGALSQGRGDCGLVKEGFRADLVVLDDTVPGMRPIFDLAGNVVYSASGSDILYTLVDGEIVYENGEYPTIDLERAIYETEKACAKIAEKVDG